jgi:DNA-binding transcriptional ArsR family regulator
MSRSARDGAARRFRASAPTFAALGDTTRLTILTRLGGGSRLSITRLTEGLPVTRQAITKHLRVLEGAGLVRGSRRGRERLFRLDPKPLDAARGALDEVSRQWDVALASLKSFVER